MKLKSVAMVVVLAAFAFNVSAAESEGTQLTYWLCYRVSQKGWTYDGDIPKPTKDPTKCWLIAPLLGDGRLNYNSKISGGITLVEQENQYNGFQIELPGLVLYSFYTSSGKKVSTYGQGHNEVSDQTYEYQRVYNLAGWNSPVRGVEPTDKKAVLYWASKLNGSFSMSSKTSTGDPLTSVGTWACTIDAKTSAAMTSTIDPNKTVADNYTTAMKAFIQSLRLKFDPTTK